MLNPIPDIGIDSILNLNIESTSLIDVPITTHDEIPPSSVTTLPPTPIPLIQPIQQTPVSTTTIVPSTSLQNLPTFGSLFKFEDRVKSLENDFSEFKQINLFAEAVSLIPDRLREESHAKNEDYINKIDENIKKIIKEQVKVQVKEQVSKILPRIKKSVNEQLEAEVLIRSSNKAKTSYAVAVNLSELELKKILIDKMENNKSIDRSVQRKNLYKALVDAYETDKDILATYEDAVTFKRRQDDEDDDEEPSAGSNRGSKRRKSGKEPESTNALKDKTSKSTGSSKEGFKSKTRSTSKSAQAEEQVHTIKDLEEPAHQEFNTGFTENQPVDETTQLPDCTLAQNEDPRESFNELIDTLLDFSAFVLNQLKVDTLTPELLAGPTFELMKCSFKSLVELEYFLEEHNYKHLDRITVRRDDDKLYTFKEDDYKRLRLQDIEDMLLLLVQGKLKNLTIEECLALSVSLRMFTRSIVIKRRVEDLQLVNSNPRGFIYQNKDKKNRLMRIDKLYKFGDGTLNDVRSALDDILKRIRIEYLP
ncbi:hypothetical protein Tco_0894142 [Tanacetum coccineum]|uniref:Uncharacterized protein n=1 Tax=Tanacetum coccineum TaxID=301880 RepID=A0ABQ5CAU4_9ASTR